MSKLKQCAFCGGDFEHRRNICCSRSCASKFRMKNASIPPWTEAELDYLQELVGNYPMRTIVKKFNKWAKSNANCRSDGAISSKIHHLGLMTRDLHDNFSVDGLAHGLGFCPSKLRRFIKKGWLQPSIVSSQRHSVSRAAAKKLILEHPHYFAACDPDRLFWILENQELVDRVRGVKPTQSKKPIPIRCHTPDGKQVVYPSIKAAARQRFIHHSAIIHAVQNGGISAGCRWEVVAQ